MVPISQPGLRHLHPGGPELRGRDRICGPGSIFRVGTAVMGGGLPAAHRAGDPHRRGADRPVWSRPGGRLHRRRLFPPDRLFLCGLRAWPTRCAAIWRGWGDVVYSSLAGDGLPGLSDYPVLYPGGLLRQYGDRLGRRPSPGCSSSCCTYCGRSGRSAGGRAKASFKPEKKHRQRRCFFLWGTGGASPLHLPVIGRCRGGSSLPPPKSCCSPVIRSQARPQPASKWAT